MALLYTDIRYKDKSRYNDELDGTNPYPKMRRIIRDSQEFCFNAPKYMLCKFVRIAS